MDYRGMSGKEWEDVVESLEDIGPQYYEKANMLMTLGMVDRWRKRVASAAGPDDVVLEIGPGPGLFTRHISSKAVYCVDPSSEFSKPLRENVDSSRVSLVRGVGEKIPLAGGSVDKAFCVFSFRDLFDKEAGIGEIHRVLREGGEVFIAEVAKPPPGPLAKMIELHFRHVVPVMARVAVDIANKDLWRRNPYAKLVQTYEAYGTTENYEALLRSAGFARVTTEYLELKGATITRGKKPWKSTSS
ncbi:MAG TPA: class I SAM-dependent methyltransferase [Thermoplasmata archaeon]